MPERKGLDEDGIGILHLVLYPRLTVLDQRRLKKILKITKDNPIDEEIMKRIDDKIFKELIK